GAVVGALAVSGLDSFLSQAEQGVHVLGLKLDLPSRTRLVFLAAIMAVVLILRPSGLTGGREARLPWPWRRGRRSASSAAGRWARCSRRTSRSWTTSRSGRTTSRENT